MTKHNLGDAINKLDVEEIELDDTDHIMDAVILLRATNLDTGDTRFIITYSKHTDFIVRRGMAELAKDFEEMGACAMIADDDDDGGTVL